MRRPLVLPLLLVLLPGAARAQAPAERAAFEAFRDSLTAAATADAIDAIVGERSAAPAVRHLRAGFAELRRAELVADRRPLDAAVQAFEEVIRRERDWPYAWFGLATAKLRLHEGEHVAKASSTQPVGASYEDGFLRAVAATMDRDAGFEPLWTLIAARLAAQGERVQPTLLLRALERAASAGVRKPELHLVLGRAYRQGGDAPRALAAFDRYLALGGDAGVGQLERARTLHALKRTTEAVAAYRDGLARGGAEGREAYRLDLGWVADADELARFDALPADSLPGWVERFWSLRDAESLRDPGARLVEHLRRWNHVQAHFRIAGPARLRTVRAHVRPAILPCTSPIQNLDGIDYFDPARSEDSERNGRLFDHRAIVYMRHGEPARRVASGGGVRDLVEIASSTEDDATTGRAPPAERARGWESWLYWFNGSPRLFHFGPSVLGDGPTTLYTEPPLTAEYLRHLNAIDGAYGRLAHMAEAGSRAFPQGLLRCHKLMQDEGVRGRRDMKLAVVEDSYTPYHDEPLEPVVQTFAVGRPERGTGRLLVVYAAPGERLRPDSVRAADGRLTYTLLVRATAIDSATGAVRRLDTLRTVAAADTLREGQHLSGVVDLALPAGRWAVRALVEQAGGAGSAFELPAPAYLQASGLTLSDLVTGRAGAGLVWAAPDGPVVLNPLGAFPRDTPMELYYELDGLRPGAEYRTTIDVRKAGANDARGGVRLSFADVAGGASTRVRRTLGLQQLKRGRYDLVVTVEERGTGRRVTRVRPLTVIDR